MNENILNILLSTIPYSWKTNIGDDGKFYAGFVTKFGNLQFELDSHNWSKVNVPVLPQLPLNVIIVTDEILEELANSNLRYPSTADIDIINNIVEESILSIFEDESDITKYVSFYME